MHARTYPSSLRLAGLLLLAQALLISPVAAQPAAGEPVLIGQSGGFTGGQAEYAKDVKLGIEAAFAAANAAGGIGGRPVKLVTADDGGKRDAVLANTKKLVEGSGVVALIGYTSGAGTEASLGYINGAKVPLLSPATGNMGIRASHSPYLFHTRAGYGDEMSKIIGHVAALGYQRIALAYLADVGPANLKSMEAALQAHRLKPAAVVGLDRNAEDFSPQVETLMQANAQLVVFISNAKPIALIVKGMRERGYGGQFATSSFAGSRVVADLKQHAPGLIMIQVLPQPTREQHGFQRDFQAALRRVSPDAKPNYTMLEGYVAGRVLVEGLKRAGPTTTPARLASTLTGLRDFDLGGYRVRFAPEDHSGSRFVDLGVVAENGRLRF